MQQSVSQGLVSDALKNRKNWQKGSSNYEVKVWRVWEMRWRDDMQQDECYKEKSVEVCDTHSGRQRAHKAVNNPD